MKYRYLIFTVLTSLAFAGSIYAAAGGLTVPQGGTGNTSFTSSQLLYGAGSSRLQSVATTTVSCGTGASCTSFVTLGSTPITITATGVGSGLATSSPIVDSNLLVYSASGAGSAYGVATGTISSGTGISLSSSVRSAIGGSLQITNSSPLSGLSTSFPLSFSNPTLSWIGLATTSNPTAGNLFYSNGTTGLVPVATSSVSAGTGISLSASPGALVGGSALTITNSGVTSITASSPLSRDTATGAVTISCPTCNTSSASVSSVATTWPISGGTITTTGTITWAGLATSSNIVNAQALYATGVNTFTSSANHTITAILDTITNASTTALTSSYHYNSGNAGFASSTPAFTLSVNNAGSDFYVDSTGKIVGRDTTNSWSGRITPTRAFVLGTGTTTSWTASTTGTAYSPFIVMPFTGTLQNVKCATDASFLGVNVTVNGSNATPSYFVASTTVGTVPFTAGNTFTAGQKVLANFGTTTSASTLEINCTFSATETP